MCIFSPEGKTGDEEDWGDYDWEDNPADYEMYQGLHNLVAPMQGS